ncbi:hypothetical protein GE09DRAFT_1262528 [Coniochaeta sp. 2T2.1]|nr:hypothetical protein GE09DRAFT_1262528 [Coniochaeta sp. 2T2.1]
MGNADMGGPTVVSLMLETGDEIGEASSHPTGKAWRLRSVSAPAKLFTKWIVNPIPVVNLDATKCDVKFADASTAPQFGEGMRELKDSDDMQVQEVDAKDSAAMNQWDARVVLLVCVIYTYVAIFFLTIAYALAVLLSHCLGSSHTTPSADQVLPRASGSETGIEKMAAIWGDPIGPVDEVEEVERMALPGSWDMACTLARIVRGVVQDTLSDITDFTFGVVLPNARVKLSGLC